MKRDGFFSAQKKGTNVPGNLVLLWTLLEAHWPNTSSERTREGIKRIFLTPMYLLPNPGEGGGQREHVKWRVDSNELDFGKADN